jgi:hypothetical protein
MGSPVMKLSHCATNLFCSENRVAILTLAAQRISRALYCLTQGYDTKLDQMKVLAVI